MRQDQPPQMEFNTPDEFTDHPQWRDEFTPPLGRYKNSLDWASMIIVKLLDALRSAENERDNLKQQLEATKLTTEKTVISPFLKEVV